MRRLEGPALAYWQQIAPQLEAQGRLEPRYELALATLCRLAADVERLRDLIMTEGWVSDGRRHPMVHEYRQFTRLLRLLLGDFGLTPPSDLRMARSQDRAARAARRQLTVLR